jgi:hypothetical protein
MKEILSLSLTSRSETSAGDRFVSFPIDSAKYFDALVSEELTGLSIEN